MKKKLTLLFFMLISSMPLYAQWQVGVGGGYSINSIEVDNNFAYDIKNSNRGGFNMAAMCGYEFTDWFTLKSEVAYTQKNYETHRSTSLLQDTYTEHTNGYVQVPIYGSVSFGGKKFRGFTNAGVYGGYWAFGWVEGSLTDMALMGDPNYFVHSYDFNKKADNRFEAGLLFGLGIMYNIDKHYAVSAEGRLQYSLTDIQKKYMENIIPKYYNTMLFNVSVTYKF